MKKIMSAKVNNALVIGFLTFFISAGWAFASPPGSSPDEDAHLTTAWCQSKYGSENCVEIPLRVVESGKCFFLDADTIPTCENKLSDSNVAPERILSGNIYYRVISNLIEESSIDRSIVLMRLLNALIFSVLVAIVTLLSTRVVWQATILGLLIVNVPLGYFIISSINSSSWPFIFISLLFPLLYNLFNFQQSILILIFKIAILILLFQFTKQVRADVILFVSIYLVTMIPLVYQSKSQSQRSKSINRHLKIILPISSVILTLFLLRELWNRSNLVNFRENEISLWENFSRIPSLITGIFGGWGLGSLEVRMPSISYVIILIIIFSIIFRSFKYSNFIELNLQILLLIFAFAIPLFVLINSNLRVGEWVQPRYVLPIFYGLIMLSILIILKNAKNLSELIPLIFLSFVAYSFALFTTLRRYTTGLATFDLDLINDESWWWSLTWIPQPILIFTISITCYLILWVYVYRQIRNDKKQLSHISFN